MKILRKVRKLINNPKGFWDDSIFNKKSVDVSGFKEGKTIVFAFRINDWKRDFIRSVYPEYNWYFVPFKKTPRDIDREIKSATNKVFVVWGYNELDGTVDYANENKIPLYRMEDGFIRSIGLGSDHVLPMSLVMDKTGTLYFDCNSESGLEKILNDFDFSSDAKLLRESSELIDKLTSNGFTKYNNFDQSLAECDKSNNRILVIGQVENDASIKYGCDRMITNLDLVKQARQENPASEIYYRPHPDIIKGNRFDAGDVAEIRKIATIMSPDTPLKLALETAKMVYVITSLVGLEAIIRDIPVVVLGKPFYAGWGLTNDRSNISRRKRTLTKYELFAAAYLVYPDYFDVMKREKTSIHNCISILENEKNKISLVTEKKSSVIKTPAFAFHVGLKWRSAIAEMLPEYEISFIELHEKDENIRPHVRKMIEGKMNIDSNIVFLVWGYLEPKGTVQLSKKLGVPIHRFEDGFIRSVGIGSMNTLEGDTNLPISITLDKQSIYYDCFNPSDIEDLLNNYDFQAKPDLLQRSRKIISRIVDEKITKYNSTVSKTANSVYGEKNRKRVLVLGQVETDQSIKHGSKYQYRNNDLIKIACKENPDAEIIYKPHPAVLKGAKNELSNPINVTHYCKVVTDEISLPESLETIDHVYVITSGSGFEAILRNIPVTCLGANFYSGWGITDDRLIIDRRKRKLSKEEVFAAFYILYTRYYNHEKHEFIEIEDALDIINNKRVFEAGVEYAAQARKCFDLNLYQNAEDYYSKAIKKNINFASWHAELGQCQFLLGKYHDAVDSYTKAISFYDSMPDWYVSLALSKKMANFSVLDVKRSFDVARLMTQNSRACQYQYFKFMIESRIATINDVKVFANKVLSTKNKKTDELYIAYKAFWTLGAPEQAMLFTKEIKKLSSNKPEPIFAIKAIADLFTNHESWHRSLFEKMMTKWQLSSFFNGCRKILIADNEEVIDPVFNDCYVIRIGTPTSQTADLWLCDKAHLPMSGDIFITNPDSIFDSNSNWFDIYLRSTHTKNVGIIDESSYRLIIQNLDCTYPDAWLIADVLLGQLGPDFDIEYTKNAFRRKFDSSPFSLIEAA